MGIAGIGYRYLHMSSEALNITMNTDYPGKRFEIGGNGLPALVSYVYSFLFPYTTQVENPCELSGMISFYPIPMILSVIFIIDDLIILLSFKLIKYIWLNEYLSLVNISS